MLNDEDCRRQILIIGRNGPDIDLLEIFKFDGEDGVPALRGLVVGADLQGNGIDDLINNLSLSSA